MAETNWYVVHTYSGYENAVKDDIEATIKSRELQDEIKEVLVPTEEVTIIRSGKDSKKGKPTMPVTSVQPEEPDNLLEVLNGASIDEEHRTIMSAVI